MEFEKDYFKIGDRYGRVLFMREYASYIKDSMISEITELNRNLMLSIDVIPVPTDEAVREAESRLLGVETNITNWQRRQNSNNNFSATVPYDMEQQKKEMKEFLDDLTTRDQRMMFAVLTCEKTPLSVFYSEISADGRSEYRNAFRRSQDRQLPYIDYRIAVRPYAVPCSGRISRKRNLLRSERHFKEYDYR